MRLGLCATIVTRKTPTCKLTTLNPMHSCRCGTSNENPRRPSVWLTISPGLQGRGCTQQRLLTTAFRPCFSRAEAHMTPGSLISAIIISLTLAQLVFSRSHTPARSCEAHHSNKFPFSAYPLHPAWHDTHRCTPYSGACLRIL